MRRTVNLKSAQDTKSNIKLNSIFTREKLHKTQYAMNKDNIRGFVLKTEKEWGITLSQREGDISETIASGLLNKYIETIEEIDDIYDDYIGLFEKIKNFIVG